MNKRIKHISNLLQGIDLNQQQNENNYQQNANKAYHPMRAVFIALDMTKTIQMKDFKPSRLSVSTQMIKHFIKKSKQSTPIIKYLFSVVEEQICKIKSQFTLDTEQIFDIIDLLKVQNTGFFSLECVLRSALQTFENISNCYEKQLLIIQASSLTKDYRNIYETINIFKQAKIKVNIVSLVGWTHVFKRLVEQTSGRYITVSTNEQFKRFIQQISIPPEMQQQNIQSTMFKVALCSKEQDEKGVLCFCHFNVVKNYYVCGFCNSITCKTPPIQCTVCKKLIIIPSDLSRHKLIQEHKQ